jgi:hypothetical protein
MDWCFKLEYVLCFTRVSNLIINIIYNNPDPDIIINHPDRPSWFLFFLRKKSERFSCPSNLLLLFQGTRGTRNGFNCAKRDTERSLWRPSGFLEQKRPTETLFYGSCFLCFPLSFGTSCHMLLSHALVMLLFVRINLLSSKVLSLIPKE